MSISPIKKQKGSRYLRRKMLQTGPVSLQIDVSQIDDLAERAGFPADEINSIAKEFEKAGIAKITRTGKELLFDSVHIKEFRRKFPSEKPEEI